MKCRIYISLIFTFKLLKYSYNQLQDEDTITFEKQFRIGSRVKTRGEIVKNGLHIPAGAAGTVTGPAVGNIYCPAWWITFDDYDDIDLYENDLQLV